MDESETGSAKLWSDTEGVRPTPQASDQWKGSGGTGRFPQRVAGAPSAKRGGEVSLAASGYNEPVERDPLERVEPRLFGVVPTLGALGLGLATLVIALIAFALGHPLLGLVLLVPALGLLALFVEAARRFRTRDAASRAALGLGERLRDWSRFALASTAARSRASRELLAARAELARLRAELRRTQLELGGAAYREDAAETERLRGRMRELEERAHAVEHATHRALGEAERRIGEERVAIQPTEVIRRDPE